MKLTFRLAIAAVLVASLTLLAMPRQAAAHPLGNFTINQYSAITVGDGKVDIFYVVDMAEVPAFQELGTIRADHSTALTQAERDAYVASKSAELLKDLQVFVNGKTLPLSVVKTALSFPPGAGGLPTLRLEMDLSVQTGAQKGTLTYRDDNYKERIGWREIIATSVAGVGLQDSSVPTTDGSNALRSYSPDLLQTPPNVSSATMNFAPSASGAASGAITQSVEQSQQNITALSWAQGRADALTDLIAQKELPIGAFLFALLLAFMFGAGHALSPGHGKTVVAAYLVGSRGTPLHALLLGLTVTFSHTIGVFLLGLVVLYAADYVLPEQLYPWLGFASGMMVAAMGVTLFVQRHRAWKSAHATASQRGLKPLTLPALMQMVFPSRRLALQTVEVAAEVGKGVINHAPTNIHTQSELMHSHDHAVDNAHNHDHPHHGHNHTHDHDHDHDHHHHASRITHHAHDHAPSVPHKHGLFSRAHTHVPADGQKATLGGLLALGISGGIIPCPSALVVLLVAIASGRVALGLVLILAFSIGLAAVLTGIGLLMVFSRGMLNRFSFGGGLLGRLPMFSAAVVACLGLLIAFEALKSGGVLR